MAAECARSHNVESRSIPTMKLSSKGACPRARPTRHWDVSSRHCNDQVLSIFAKRGAVAENNFPPSIVQAESRVRCRAGSRNMVRVSEPKYFNARPLERAFEKCRFEKAAPLVQFHRPLGTEWSSADASVFRI